MTLSSEWVCSVLLLGTPVHIILVERLPELTSSPAKISLLLR